MTTPISASAFPCKIRTACNGHRPHGFTLIELMIVVVIVAILAAVAYPAYTRHVEKSRRVDAQTALMELAQFMERHYTTNSGTYVGATLPFNTSPKEGSSTAYYNLSLATPSSQEFTLTATPQPSQSSDPCGTLTINQAGTRTPATGNCWN